MSDRIYQWATIGVLVIVACSVIVFSLYQFYLTIIVTRIPTDELFYADIGRIITDGGVPFREIWDIKPPVNNYLVVPFILLFGNTMLAVRLAVIFTGVWFIGATTLLVWVVSKNRLATVCAAVAAFLYAAWQAQLEGHNPVTVMMVLATTAMLVAAVGRGRPLWMVASGVLMALSFYSKQVVLFEGFAAVAFAAYFAPPGRRIAAARILIVGGLAGVIGGVLLAWWAGVLESLWLNAFYNSFLYAFEVGGNNWHFNSDFMPFFRLYFMGQTLPFLLPLLVMMVPALFVLLRDPETKGVAWVVILWVITAFMGAMIGRSMRRSYFLEMLGALILINALAVPHYVMLRPRWRLSLALLLAASLLGNGILTSTVNSASALLAIDWRSPDDSPILEPYRDAAAVLVAHTEPDECLWQWDTIGAMTYFADRRPCNTAPAAHVAMIIESFDMHRIRSEYMNELFAAKPSFHTRYDIWGYFPELERFAERYRRDLVYTTRFPSYNLDMYMVDMSVYQEQYANFGLFEMIGYDLYGSDTVCTGETLNVSMTWRAIEPPERYYNLFLQLLTQDQTARLVGIDAQPHSRIPTRGWTQPGMLYLGDTLTLAIPANARPGTYLLVTGFYDTETFERLPAKSADGQPLPGNYILLTPIHVISCD